MSDSKQDAWQRAEIVLAAYSEIKNDLTHIYDTPDTVITDFLTDLLHYCHTRNRGKDPDCVYYLNFEDFVAAAKKQFLRQQES